MIFIAASRIFGGGNNDLAAFWHASLEREAKAARSWHDCRDRADIIRLARRARETVVAVGGDGLINCVINGLMMSGGQAPLGVLPAGHSDFCLSHGMPIEKTAALATVLNGERRPIDLIEARLTGGTGERAGCYFSAGAALGLGLRPGAGAFLRFASAWRQRSFKCHLTLDGEKFEFSQADHLLIFKNPVLAAALGLPRETLGLDGRAALLLFHNCSKTLLVSLLSRLAAQKPLPKENIFARAFKRAAIINDRKLPVDCQGRAIGFTPMEIEIKPGALEIIAP